MLTPQKSRAALLRLFRTKRVVTLDAVFGALETHSRMSAFRRLSILGYLTSYTHAGRYYTLEDIPKFDEDGLWHHQGVAFSRQGSLKNTVEHLVSDAEAGRTHPELELKLRVRAHNALLDLVEQRRIARVTLTGRNYIYVSAKRHKAKAQITRRKQEIAAAALLCKERLSSAVIVDVLREVLQATRVKVEPRVISARLAARGVSVTAAQVEALLEEYGLKKTAKSRSRRSRC